MENSILVTGGTGTLGRAVVARLADRNVRVLSRKRDSTGHTPSEWARGDLRTGAGLAEAVADVDVIIHCATSLGRADIPATRNLLDAASGGGAHLVYVSIAGCDRIPLGYYRVKHECERIVEASGLPWTILRATQFHDLIARIFTVQRRLPAVLVPAGVSFQPIDVRDVAGRLADIASRAPAGRAPDIGGPQVRSAVELARAHLAATGHRRPVVPLAVPGKTFRGYREGRHLVPANPAGRITFDEYLAGPA